MIIRLRPKYSEEELKVLYSTPNDHTKWWEHAARTELTIAFALTLLPQIGSVADLSAGKNAAIALSLDADEVYLGDFAEQYEIEGPIEETICEIPTVDAFVLSETLEHVDEPDVVLSLIRDRSKYLILSTPNGETTPHNPEHYWGWDTEGISELLETTGWVPLGNVLLNLPTYNCQIWVCE